MTVETSGRAISGPPVRRGAGGVDAAPAGAVGPIRLIGCREWSDRDLVASLADNCSEAYVELLRRYSSSVTVAVRKVLVNDSQHEDVVADVFAALWSRPETFDPQRGSLPAFLRMKARGRSIDLVRTEAARQRREAAERHVSLTVEQGADAAVLAAESSLAVRHALDLLPDAERVPILLAYFAGMHYGVVAAHLGLPEGTVKSRIRSGLRRLRSSLEMVPDEQGAGDGSRPTVERCSNPQADRGVPGVRHETIR